MGICASSDPISSTLKKEYVESKSIIRILLLGAGECGKSTILKQMKILHRNGFSPEEIQEYKAVILDNTLQSIRTLLAACDHFGMAVQAESFESNVLIRNTETITPTTNNTNNSNSQLNVDSNKFAIQDLIPAIQILWRDPIIQMVFERANEYTLLDSAPYFLNQVHRTFLPDYEPTFEDILRARKATQGITETDFTMDRIQFKMYDVGGQRGERKKWIHCFEDVKAILFIASLNEYDQVLAEDPTRNRLEESLTLFEGILTLPWFKNTPVILFLNKNDLFAKKCLKTDLGIYFNDYVGGLNHEYALFFIKEMFFARNSNPNKTVYAHVTDATDTKQIEFVWKAVKHIVMQTNLAKAGLMTMT